MKRVLFLDDDRRRAHEFYGHGTTLDIDMTLVETADACIAALRDDIYDLVLLDHDLGGETFCDSSREDCGMEVVRWLKSNGGEHGAFIVHTMNPMAAAAMYIELKSIGYRVRQAPFGTVEFYKYLHELLDHDAEPPKKRSKSIGDRLTEYFRSLRLGR